MTTATSPTMVRRSRLRRAVSDTLLVTWRNLLGYRREPQVVIFLVVQPIMFVLLFVYVFGGAIRTAPGVNYVDFLLAGIIVQTVTFGTAGTGVSLAGDLSKGIIDRFRSLPMSRVAVLAGRATVDLVQALFSVLLMVGVGALAGFRFHQGIGSALAALGLSILFGFAFSWIAMWVGLLAGTPEAAQSGGFIWLFPLTFASSAFVPIETMPSWLRAFAEWNPITAMVDAVRGLTLGVVPGALPLDTAVTRSLLWMAVVVAVFGPLAVRRFRRST